MPHPIDLKRDERKLFCVVERLAPHCQLLELHQRKTSNYPVSNPKEREDDVNVCVLRKKVKEESSHERFERYGTRIGFSVMRQ